MNGLNALALGPLHVDLILSAGILVLLLGDALLPPGKHRWTGVYALMLLLGCFGLTFVLELSGAALSGAYVGDGLSLLFKRIFLGAAMVAVLGSIEHVDEQTGHRQGEYYQLLLFSVLGMSLLAGARDLILLAVAFELMGIPLYVLASFGRTRGTSGKNPAEAGLKLYVVGAASSVIALYGLSLVYGMAGTTSLVGLAQVERSPLLLLGMVAALAGFGFKIGVVPFHMWVPDTYEGTSTPFAAFLSVAPKAAGLVAIVQLMLGGLIHLESAWVPTLTILVVATIVLGNLLALRQSNLKRLMAFSGVAHMGFMLLGIIVAARMSTWKGLDAGAEGLATLIFYVVGYLAGNMGLFLALEALGAHARRSGGASELAQVDTLEAFVGLGRRTPWLAVSILLFLLSLAGIPFVVGFWAKLYVLLAAWRAGFEGLVVLGATFSVVGLFYYLQWARAIYMRKPAVEDRIEVTPALALGLVVCIAATVGMGLYPAPFIDAARDAALQFLTTH